MRYVIIECDLDWDHPLWPNERLYKIKDIKTGTVSFAGYKSRERAEHWLSKKNEDG